MMRLSSLLQVQRSIAVLAKTVPDELRRSPTASRNSVSDIGAIAVALSGKSFEITIFILE